MSKWGSSGKWSCKICGVWLNVLFTPCFCVVRGLRWCSAYLVKDPDAAKLARVHKIWPLSIQSKEKKKKKVNPKSFKMLSAFCGRKLLPLLFFFFFFSAFTIFVTIPCNSLSHQINCFGAELLLAICLRQSNRSLLSSCVVSSYFWFHI